MQKVIAMMALLVVASCGGMPTQRGMDQLMQSWDHGNVNDFIAKAGPPAQVYDMPNGNKVFVFGRSETYTTPAYTSPTTTTVQTIGNTAYATTYPGTTSGGQSVTTSCTIFFEVDSSQTIVSGHYEGNNCRVRERN